MNGGHEQRWAHVAVDFVQSYCTSGLNGKIMEISTKIHFCNAIGKFYTLPDVVKYCK